MSVEPTSRDQRGEPPDRHVTYGTRGREHAAREAAPAESGGTPIIRLNRQQMLLVYVAGSYGFAFQSMVSLLVPLRLAELGTPVELIGVVVGAGSVAPALLSVVSGAFADRIGPKNAYVLGAATSACWALLFAATDNYWVMLVLQVVMGLSRGTAWVAAQTYVTSIGTRAERATITSRFSFASNAGPLLGPLATGAVAQVVGFQLAFVFVALVGGLYTLIGFAVAETRRPAGDPAPALTPMASTSANRGGAGFGTALHLLRRRPMQVALMLTLVRLWIWAGWMAFYPVHLAAAGLEPVVIGTVLSTNGLVAAFATLMVGRLSRLASPEILAGVASAVGTLGVALSGLFTTLPWVYLPTVLIGAGYGISLPILLVIAGSAAPRSQRGVALGMRTSANQVASALSPVFVGVLIAPLGVALSFMLNAALGTVVLTVAMWLHLRGGKPREAA